MSEVSVADAKSRLPRLIHEAEAGVPVHITRHGRRVAVLVSEAEYRRLASAAPTGSVWDVIETWRATTAPNWPEITAEETDSWRDRSTGRKDPWGD